MAENHDVQNVTIGGHDWSRKIAEHQLDLARQKIDIMERWLRSIIEFCADQQEHRTLPDPLIVVEAMARAGLKSHE